jgi:hypothetical protein
LLGRKGYGIWHPPQEKEREEERKNKNERDRERERERVQEGELRKQE